MQVLGAFGVLKMKTLKDVIHNIFLKKIRHGLWINTAKLYFIL